MSPVKLLLIAFVLLAFMSVSAPAQDKKPGKPNPVSWSEEREPKNEVEQQLAAAAKRGEIVLATCIDAACGDDGSDESPVGFERGRAIKLAKPSYSSLARAAHVSGSVGVQVIIDVDGKVIAAVAVSGHPLLQAASVKAARDSEFTPTKWEGRPVKVVGVITYNFVAQ
jgi:TonB family protein